MEHTQPETTLTTPTLFQLQEEERYRMARSLMEGPGQILANAVMELEHALGMIQADPQAARKGLSDLRDEVRGGLEELQALVSELHPPLLVEMGLGPCLARYLRDYTERTGIRGEYSGAEALAERLPTTIETAVFRIVQEALVNTREHSGASRVEVRVQRLENQFQFVIEDDGQGFRNEPAKSKRRQLGLVSMRDRAQLVGGTLQIFSVPGKGLRVVATVPYHGHEQGLPAGGQNENGRQSQNGRENAGSRKRT